MAKTLSCYVDMFSLSQSVIFPNGEEARIATKDLRSYLPTVCYSHGYDKIHLFGNEKFLEEIVESLQPFTRKLAHFTIYTIGGFILY